MTRSIPALLDRTIAAHGTRPAVSDARETLTFHELGAAVARTSTKLRETGIGPGGRVAVALPNSCTFVRTALAVLQSGASLFPINANAQPDEVARILGRTPVAAVVGPDELIRTHAPDGAAALTPRDADLAIVRARRDATPVEGDVRPGDPALVAYSSGTVHRPHLVTRTHENLWWEAENFYATTRLAPSDVALAVVPLSHAHGFGNALLASLRAGARLVTLERFQRTSVLDTLHREGVTIFPTVPFMIRMLTTADRRRSWSLDALAWCISAGAPLVPEVADAFRARFGLVPRQLYGLTEVGSVTLNSAPDVGDPTSVGTPLGTNEIEIVDDDGRPVAPGAEGEIVIRSDAAMGGRDTALRTRDRGRHAADGSLRITGRTSLFINCAGNKVDPGEVEEVLRAHPAVEEAAVFGVPAAHGEETITAAVVLRDGSSADALREHCRERLAGYKVPRVVHVRDDLPRSPLGKVLVGRLADEVASVSHQ